MEQLKKLGGNLKQIISKAKTEKSEDQTLNKKLLN